MRTRTKIFILISAIALLLDAVFVVLNQRYAEQHFAESLEEEGRGLEAAADVAMSTTLVNMLQLATFISEDPEVLALFRAGKEAVEREGGGRGGPAAKTARDALLKRVSPMWTRMTGDFDVRQLHFHLGPGSLSFLRVHQPDRFGDRMDGLRFIIVDVNDTQTPRMGFETGRIYSGLRGVVPVWETDPKTGRRIHLGALEVGTSFTNMLDLLDRSIGRGVAVLLKRAHVDDAMWAEFVDTHLGNERSDCSCYVEATSRPLIYDLIRDPTFREGYEDKRRTFLMTSGGRTYAVTRFPLLDYLSKKDPARGPVGSFAVWSDVTARAQALARDNEANILYAAGAFLILEIVLFATLGVAFRQLERKVEEKTVQHARIAHHLDTILNSAGEGILGLGPDGHTTFANRAAEQITGWTADEMLGRDPHALFHHCNPDGSQIPGQACAIAQSIIDGQVRRVEADRFRRKDGSSFPVDFVVSPMRNGEAVSGAVIVFRDVSQREELEGRIRHLAFHDALTGLPNRALFEEKQRHVEVIAQRRGLGIAVLYIDLDGFKAVNDRMGHAAGDRLLRDVAERLKQCLREEDVLARLGGDEFVALLLLDTIVTDHAVLVAQRMIAALKPTFHLEEGDAVVGASIGIAVYPTTAADLNLCLRCADLAMYAAKRHGKNRCEVFDATSEPLRTA